jgi:glycosyltransferase involved in cell wall biosynthesis
VIEPSGNLYGSEFCLLDILEGLDRDRFIVHVYTPQQAPFSRRLQDAGISHSGILVQRAAGVSRWRKGVPYLRLLLGLIRHRPDLLYVNEGGILRPVLLLARLLRLPVVCQVQTLEDARWISSLHLSLGRVAAYVCNSEFIAAQTKVPSASKCTIYQGYKRKGLRRERPPVEKQQAGLVVGLLGRIGASKGHDLVLDVAERLARKGESRFLFRFIGEAATPQESQDWRAQVAARGLAGLVEFRGYCTDIAAELAQLYVMVVPSPAEPFGRILCEAAEAGVPVLVSDSGGLGELSRRFDVGVRHRPRDVEDFVEQLTGMWNDYAGSCQRFAAGAERLLEAFDYGAYIGQIERILKKAARGEMVSVEWYGEQPTHARAIAVGQPPAPGASECLP